MKMIRKFILATTISLLGIGVTACGGGGESGPTKVDYVHDGSCTLTIDYAGKDFYKDGIGQFDLWTCIDGDTAHFSPVVTATSRAVVKSRFYGVDTPESTGRVQPYGKPASDFTKKHLKNAAENGTIVVACYSNEYKDPTAHKDGNDRYLSCIWINEERKNAPYDTLVNLNLWLVQEGFSGISSLDDMPEYKSVFLSALSQAKTLKLNMHSGLPDPTYNYGDYKEAYIPDICREINKQLKDPTYENPFDGEKVRIEGTVVGYSSGTLYMQKYDDPEYVNPETGEHGDGKYYSINIFCGMQVIPKKYSAFGAVLRLNGLCKDSEEFGFQITDVESHFPKLDDEEYLSESDVRVLVPASQNTEDPLLMPYVNYLTASELSQIATNEDLSILNSPVSLVKESGHKAETESDLDPVVAKKCKPNSLNNKWTIQLNSVKFDLYVTTPFRGDPSTGANWDTNEEWVDKRLGVNLGVYTYHSFNDDDGGKTYNYQIVFSSVNNGELLWLDRPIIGE